MVTSRYVLSVILSKSAAVFFPKQKSYFVVKPALSKIFLECTNEQGTLDWVKEPDLKVFLNNNLILSN